MIDLSPVDDVITKKLNDSLNELVTLCAQPSISAQGIGIQDCAQLLAKMLKSRSFKTKIFPSAGFPVVYAERIGSSSRTLLFYNHYDVQPPDPLDSWQSPPFTPTIRDGRMFARGVNDDKGHIICRLAAIDALLEVYGELPCTVKFLIEGEEEIGSTHLPSFIENHLDLLKAEACIWEFGRLNRDGIPIQHAGQRGICYLELSSRTAEHDTHSGLGGSIFPNAAWRLIWALRSIKDSDEKIHLPGFYDNVLPPSERDLELLAMLPAMADQFKENYGLGDLLHHLTNGVELQQQAVFEPACTICGLTAGYQGTGSKTIIPSSAKAKLDFRLVPEQRPSEVVEQLRAHLDKEGFDDIEITFLGGQPPARTDPDHPFIQLVVETAREVYGVPQLIAPMSGGSGPSYFFRNLLELPVATAGVAHLDARTHAPNENLVIDHFVEGVRHTARILVYFAAD